MVKIGPHSCSATISKWYTDLSLAEGPSSHVDPEDMILLTSDDLACPKIGAGIPEWQRGDDAGTGCPRGP